jgi:hypothetical protein
LPTVEIAIPLLVVVSAALKPVLYSQTRVMDAVNKMLTPEPLRSLRLYLTYK